MVIPMSTRAGSVSGIPRISTYLVGNAHLAVVMLSTLAFLPVVMTAANPLLAAHPSRAIGYGLEGVYDWPVSPAWMLLGSVLLVWATLGCPLPRDPPSLVWIGLLLLSGVLNGGIETATRTYVFDAGMCLMMSGIAWRQAVYSESEWARPGVARVFAVTIAVLGLAMAMCWPDLHGAVWSERGGVRRGEIALWQVFGIWLVAPVMLLEPQNRRGWLGFYLWPMMVAGLLVVSVGHGARTESLCIAIALVVWILGRSTLIGRGSLVGALILVGILGSEMLSEWALRGYDPSDYAGVTTGRYHLWEIHWDRFLSAPLMGNGAFMLRSSDVERHLGVGGEVGVLRWFSEHGVLYGICGLYIIARGSVAACCLLGRANRRPFDTMAYLTCLMSVPAILIERMTRVLGNDSALAFWAMFFCYYRIRVEQRRATAGEIDQRQVRGEAEPHLRNRILREQSGQDGCEKS